MDLSLWRAFVFPGVGIVLRSGLFFFGGRGFVFQENGVSFPGGRGGGTFVFRARVLSLEGIIFADT